MPYVDFGLASLDILKAGFEKYEPVLVIFDVMTSFLSINTDKSYEVQQNLENLRRNGVTPISMASTYSYKKPGHHRPGATSCALSIAIFLIMPCPPWIPL
jgi:hypothetical protein